MKSLLNALLPLWPALLLLSACATTHVDKTKDWTAQHLYLSGRKALQNKEYTRAIQRFETLEARYPYGNYAKRAEMDVAYAYYRNDNDASAIAAANRFIRLHPTDPQIDYAYYLKGLAHFNAHRSIIYRIFHRHNLIDRDDKSALKAIQAFRQVVTRYPTSVYAHDAYQRMIYLMDLLGQNSADVAQYYYRRGVYVAAVNRARYVIRHFQQTPAVEEALAIQAMAYRRMGLLGLSRDSTRVLRANFPHSRYLAKIAAIPKPAAH